MRIVRKVFGAAAGLGFLLASLSAWAAPATWRLGDGDTEIVLFGSMHALPKGAQWRTPELEAAIAAADEVWFEFPAPNAAGVSQAYAEAYKTMPKPPEKVSALLSERAKEKAIEAFGSLAAVDSKRPTELINELARRYWAGLGADLENGVETTIQRQVPIEKQRAFGKPEQHLKISVGAPVEDQIRELEVFLLGHHNPEPLRRATEAWLAGDMGYLHRESVERMKHRSPGDYSRVVAERNVAWTEEIVRMLDRPGKMLIVVGAGHMAGPEGLPALLRAKGLRVEGP
ncbi:MAG TPA: TraB/GumN family protein [Caulobacteraceae bacterium]